jgi:copper resistance protein D
MVEWLVAARTVQFGASIVAGGGAVFIAGVAGGGRAPGESQRSLASGIDGTVIAALLAAIVSGALWLSLFRSGLEQAFADDDGQVTMWSVVTDTQFGRVSALRFLIAVLLIGLCSVRYARPLPRSRSLDWLGALLGLALVASLAWCGHAGSGMGTGGNAHLAADAVHLAAAAFWVGGLIPLLLLLRPSLPLTPLERYGVVRRFSTVAMWSVALLVLSGLLNTWFMTNGFRDLIGTDYGDLLLIKIALFILMLGFAALNRFRLTPRLLAAGAASQALWWSVATELALGLLVILAVGVLGQTEPPGHMHGGVSELGPVVAESTGGLRGSARGPAHGDVSLTWLPSSR